MSSPTTTCHLTLASVSMLRLPLPQKPKRLEASKLVATCASKALHSSCLPPPMTSWWFCDEPQLAATQLPLDQASTPGHRQFSFAPSNPTGFLATLLAQLTADVALVYYGTLAPPASGYLKRFAQAAEQLYPELLDESRARRQHALAPRSALSRLAPSMEAAFVVQEKPGKMLVTHPWQELERARRLHASAPPRSVSSAVEPAHEGQSASVPQGWGASVALFSRRPLALGARISLTSAEFTAPPAEQAISLPLALVADIAAWLTKLRPVGSAPLERFLIVAPTLALAALLEAAWSRQSPPLRYQDEAILSPDFVLGWAPLLTFIDFMNCPQGSRLLLDASRFPQVEAFLVTSDAAGGEGGGHGS